MDITEPLRAPYALLRTMDLDGVDENVVIDKVVAVLSPAEQAWYARRYVAAALAEQRGKERRAVETEAHRDYVKWKENRNAEAKERSQRRRHEEREARQRTAEAAAESGLTIEQYEEVEIDRQNQLWKDLSDGYALLHKLRAVTFPLSDGRTVTWGTASTADHQERIDMQQRFMDGCAQDIDLHRAAIGMIVDLGVACLDDVAAKRAAG